MSEINKQIHSKRDDIRLSRPIVWFFVLTAICVFGRQSVLASLPLSETMYNIVRYGGTLGLFLIALPKIKKKYHVWFLGLEVLFGFSYLLSYLRGYMLSANIVTYCVITLVICIPSCIAIASIDNYEILYKRLLYGSFPIAAIVILFMFSPANTSLYSMSGAYQLVLTGAIHYNEVYRSKKWKWLFLFLTGLQLVAIFIKGARGPLLCLIAFLAIKTFFEFRGNIKAMAFSFLGIVALVIAAQNSSTIMSWVGVKLDSAGLYSRNFQYIMNNELFNDSGRNTFRDRAIDLIWENPLFGYSASSDVKLLGGQYTHSLPIELVFDFGIIVGGLLFIYLTYHVLHSFLIPGGTEKDLRMIFLTQGYLMLFFSGTYLQSVYLFLFLGMAISSIYGSRIKIRRLARK